MTDFTSPHMADLAGAYAAGALTQDEAAMFESHVMTCEPCRDRLREAEEAILLLIEAGEMHEAPPQLRARIIAKMPPVPRTASASGWLAIAAAFIIGLIPAAWLYGDVMRARSADAVHNVAIASLVHSHFVHAQFQPLVPDAPKAKVLFARDGSWLYVVIAAPAADLQVGTVANAQTRVLGAPAGINGASEFYTRTPVRIDNLVLLRNGRIIARVALPRAP